MEKRKWDCSNFLPRSHSYCVYIPTHTHNITKHFRKGDTEIYSCGVEDHPFYVIVVNVLIVNPSARRKRIA